MTYQSKAVQIVFNPLSANPTKWSNRLLSANCLSVLRVGAQRVNENSFIFCVMSHRSKPNCYILLRNCTCLMSNLWTRNPLRQNHAIKLMTSPINLTYQVNPHCKFHLHTILSLKNWREFFFHVKLTKLWICSLCTSAAIHV